MRRTAVELAGPVALVLAAALAILLHAKARLEERWLEELDPSYADYRHRVRRNLLPWLY